MVLDSLNTSATDVLGRTLISFDGGELTVGGVLLVALILVGTWIFSRYVRRSVMKRMFERRDMDEGLQYLMLKVTNYVILLVGIFIALNMIGIQLTALVALAGVAGLALGFGLQTIVSNFVSGIIIMAERNIVIGDIIEVGGEMGRVVNIEARATTIKTFDNVSVVVPNEDFIAEAVINWSHGDPKVRVHVPVGVAYGSDAEQVRELLLNIAEDHDKVMGNPEPAVRFEEFGDSSLEFLLLAWVRDPTIRKEVQSDLNFTIDRRFREEEITLPFPQRSVWFKNELETRGKDAAGEPKGRGDATEGEPRDE